MKKIFIILLVALSFPAFALMEVGADFGYNTKTFGENRQNEIINRTYSASLAFYFSTLTAVEFNYTYDDKRTYDRSVVPLTGLNSSIVSTFNQTNTVVYGLGLRQALSSKTARLRPLLSAGYARQLIEDGSIYTIRNDSNGSTNTVDGTPYEATIDSVFLSFILQYQVAGGLSLKGSVYSVFEAFEWSEAKDDLKYKVGLSWIF